MMTVEQLREDGQARGYVASLSEDEPGVWELTFANGSFQQTWEDTFPTEQEALQFGFENVDLD